MPNIDACDFLRGNPFRPADWRWRRAAWLVANNLNASRKRDDEDTSRAAEFMRALNRVGELGCRRLMRRFPAIVLAVKLREASPLTVLELECRVLGRQPAELIAEHLEVPITVVEAFKTYFFDIDDRIDASSLIVHRIIGPPTFGATAERSMKLSVYHHGPAAIEAWLDFVHHRDEVHDLNTFEGWRRDSIDVFLRAQELAHDGTGAEQLLKGLPFIMGSWREISVFRSVSSVFREVAMKNLSRLSWPQPAASVEQPPERRATPRRRRYKTIPMIARVG